MLRTTTESRLCLAIVLVAAPYLVPLALVLSTHSVSGPSGSFPGLCISHDRAIPVGREEERFHDPREAFVRCVFHNLSLPVFRLRTG
jgi:hypothetical protein